MKKFSKITNVKVNEKPVEKIEKSNDKIIEEKLLSLMDDFLKVQYYGTSYQHNGDYRITGKEILSSAIVEMLSEITNNKTKKVLESLKSKTKDWNIIDEKIDELDNSKVKLNHRKTFNDLVRLYGEDEELLVEVCKEKFTKINNKERLDDYYKLIESTELSDNTKNSIKNIIDSVWN
jgi:hypothetical protein